MSTKHLLAEDLLPIVEFPSTPITDENLAKVREMSAAVVVMGDPEKYNVTRKEIMIAGEGGDIRCLLYTPNAGADKKPGYLHIHGGGYVMGSPEGSDIQNIQVCARVGAVVLSVAYRLPPEHPIPAPLDDCYSALAWLHQNAESLSVDASRIGIGGESAGGGLAAALAIRARDAGEYGICHQHLTYPMLDNLTGSKSHPGDPLVGEFVWTRQRNQFGWSSYLGEASAIAPQVPARVEDYSKLPRTWMFTVSMDLFRDENLEYAQQLMLAGVDVELAVYPNACHGFQFIPTADASKRYFAEHIAALARGLGVKI